MAITLSQQIDTYYGSTINYGIAHLNDNNYAGVQAELGWESSGAHLTYWCAWEDLQDFIRSILGLNVVSDGPPKRYSRFIPHQYPVSVLPNFFAHKISSLKGIPGKNPNDNQDLLQYPQYDDSAFLRYAYAEVTVEYLPVDYNVLPDSAVPYNQEWLRFTSVAKVPRFEFVNIQGGTLYWIDSPPKKKQSGLPHNIPLAEQLVDWVVTFHKVPEAFFNPSDFIGFCNDSDGFMTGHPQVPTEEQTNLGGFDKETMLLRGVQEKILTPPWEANLLYEYAFFFQERPNTHNASRRSQPKIDPPTYDYNKFSLDGLVPTTNSTRAVKSVNMSRLFLPN